MHSLEMQIGADCLTLNLTITLSPPIALLNPKSVGCDIVSRATTVPSFRSFRLGVFVVHIHPAGHAATYPHTHTYTISKSSLYRRRLNYVAAPMIIIILTFVYGQFRCYPYSVCNIVLVVPKVETSCLSNLALKASCTFVSGCGLSTTY